MLGVVICGGVGTRLLPITKVVNKSCLPIGNKPLIYWPIEKLKEAGIVEVMLITGTEHLGQIVELVGDGSDLGVNVSYKIQKKPAGIAQALYLAKDFVGDGPFVAILGDNIFENKLTTFVDKWSGIVSNDPRRPIVMVMLKEVADPCRFGVAVVENGKITKIIEKPSAPSPSQLAVTGLYFYCGKTLFNMIENLQPSARGELEISDLNSKLLISGTLYHEYLTGYWQDAGTFSSFRRANQLVSEGESSES